MISPGMAQYFYVLPANTLIEVLQKIKLGDICASRGRSRTTAGFPCVAVLLMLGGDLFFYIFFENITRDLPQVRACSELVYIKSISTRLQAIYGSKKCFS